MTNAEAANVLQVGYWYDELPEVYRSTHTKKGKDLLEAIDLAAEALSYSISITENNHFSTLEITVPKGTKVGRVLVTEDGKRFGSLYYPE